MNPRRKIEKSRKRGLMLMEVLVYIALFVVVVGAASKTFFECWENSRALRRNADDIARALDIGERWRADVRAARGPVRLAVVDGAEQFRIPASAGAIVYTFSNGELRRQAGPAAPNTLWLPHVKSSQMQSEPRGPVTAWRWEIELQAAHRDPLMHPLFTFECAAGTATIP